MHIYLLKVRYMISYTVRFTPDCAPMLLVNGLGHTIFHFTIGCHHCEVLLIKLLCDKLLSSPLLQ